MSYCNINNIGIGSARRRVLNGTRGGLNGTRGGGGRTTPPQGQRQRPPPIISVGDEDSGARLSFDDLLQRPALDPLRLEGDGPRAFPRAIRRPRRGVMIIPPPADISNSREESDPAPIFVMKSPETDPSAREQNRRKGIPEDGVTKAYAKIRKSKPRWLDHHAKNWGCILFGVIYTRSNAIDTRSNAIGGDLVFDAPTPGEAQHVAIKVLHKEVVRNYLQAGGEENPYREISLMEQLGDGVHVLPLIEVLEDDRYLFIVMPRGLGTLVDVIHWKQPPVTSPLNRGCSAGRIVDMTPAMAHGLFVKILKILLHLLRNNVCHHDISPDNFLFLSPDNLVLFDFGMAVRMPTLSSDGDTSTSSIGDDGPSRRRPRRQLLREQRTLIKPQGNFGTRAYMSPEVWSNRFFDGVAADLWSAAVILYNMLTNQVLYYTPDYTDISFRYNILAGGMSSVPVNDRTVEILMDIFNPDDNHNGTQRRRDGEELLLRAMAHQCLSPQARELLENLLQKDPSRRWTLSQAIESDYVQRPPPPPPPRP